MTNKIMKFILKSIKKIIITVGIIVLILFSTQTAYNYGYNIFNKPSAENKLIKDVTVVIPQGATTQQIADILEEKNLIGSSILFRIAARLDEYDGKFQYGTYELNTSMSEDDIMKILMTEGEKRKDIEFTIPEGYTVEQIGKKLANNNICSAEEFEKAVNEVKYDFNFIKDIPDRYLRLQGYLFPDTYRIREGATAKEIVTKMLTQFDRVFKKEYYSRAEELGYTMDEIVVIASIIEREARVAEERSKMASVIYNRLDQNMNLGMCSTVLYALGKAGQPVRKLYTRETRVESPYNTYINVGLPLGPISNPGAAAIEAALYPDETNYLYFVLKDPKEGAHHFSVTYEEHINAKNKYIK